MGQTKCVLRISTVVVNGRIVSIRSVLVWHIETGYYCKATSEKASEANNSQTSTSNRAKLAS